LELALSRAILLLLLCLSICNCDFRRSHNDYEPNLLNMEMGWGATHCIDFQEVSTLWRPITFEPALVVNCELKSHQCITIRAVNSTHYYTFQGCLPQARVSPICTEMAYEASKNNGAEYFYCYDVSYDRLNVPRNVPLAGRECCCNGDFCNRIENVKTLDLIIPHDQILNPYFRTLHLWYWNALRVIGFVSTIAIIFFWGNILYIVFKPAEQSDDSAWYAAPIQRNQVLYLDITMDDDVDAIDDPIDIGAEALKTKAVEVSKKKKKGTKRKTTKEALDDNVEKKVEKTQENSNDDKEKENESSLPPAKTGDDGPDEKKEEKKASKETTEKEKKDETTPIDAKEKRTQEAEPKKDEGGLQFKLPKAPKRLANGRIQYVSMFNSNSDYSDDEDEKK
ncbi:hypothetical protein PMAYCL1PPCAC_23442, partial [Pristionchus mayeri]